jgi:hypothetical protein
MIHGFHPLTRQHLVGHDLADANGNAISCVDPEERLAGREAVSEISLVEGKGPHHVRDCGGDGLGGRIEQYSVRGDPQDPGLEAAGTIVAFEDGAWPVSALT